ncbi:hypothetical protein FA13DRAFT_1612088, partial [Coprinellus micaceus]
MTLPKGIRTLRHMRSKRESRPDNVFCNDTLTDRIIACNICLPERCPNTDHYPIATIIDASKGEQDTQPRPNFKKVDWKEFEVLLGTKLAHTNPSEPIVDEVTFNLRVEGLTNLVQDTIRQAVPTSRPSSYSRRWWDEHLEDRRREKIRLLAESNRYRAMEDHPSHKTLRQFMNEY